MAADFNISIQRDLNRLHLDLMGDFDDDSASKLIDVLKNNCKEASVICIQANGLRQIYPSGVDTFQHRLSRLNDFCYRLVFAGENASRIDPGWIEYF